MLHLYFSKPPTHEDQKAVVVMRFGLNGHIIAFKTLLQNSRPSQRFELPSMAPSPLTEQGQGFLHPPDSFAALEASQ